MVQALYRWWHPVSSSEAWDVLNRAMQPVLYRCIATATEIASNLPVFFRYRQLFVCTQP